MPESTDWTQFSMDSIPKDARQTLATRARQQTVERYGQPAKLFDQAEALVRAGHATLTAQGMGLVYDRYTWAIVTLSECGHCPHLPGICVHKLAIAYIDLLARHLPDPDPNMMGEGLPTEPRGRPLPTPRRPHNHCPHCGGFLTAGGGCNKCGGAR